MARTTKGEEMTTEKKTTQRSRRGRGEGGIGQRNGRWFGSISLGFDGNGKRIRHWVYGASKKEVQDELRKLQDQAETGGIPQPGKISVGDLLTTWIEANTNKWALGTRTGHDQHCRNHIRPAIGNVKLKDLNSLHVQGMMNKLETNQVSAAMQRHVAVTLRAALSYAVRMKLASFNAATAVPLPAKPKHHSEGLTVEQIATFLAAARTNRLFPMYLLAIDAGLRQGELLALTWKDIDLERGTVKVSKSLEEVGGSLKLKSPKNQSSIRVVKLSTATLEAMERHRRAMLIEGYCNPNATVFCGKRHGQWLRKSDVYRHSFEPILKRAGLKFRFHDLRHASASLLLADGVDVKTVQSRLGHSAAAITMNIYAHAMDRGQKTAADKMQRILKPKATLPGESKLV
jgi:integrase